MRKVICAAVFIISALVLATAMNQTFINNLKQERYFDHLTPPGANKNSLRYRLLIRSDRWRYGDLYGLSFLHDYKFPLEPFKDYETPGHKHVTGKLLYIIGDSYMADKRLNNAFDEFDNVIFLDRRFPLGPISLDSSKQNYLVMEFAERNLNSYDINKTQEKKWTPTQIAAKVNFNQAENSPQGAVLPPGIAERLNRVLFNKDLSRNLELLLFDDKIFTRIKELKAALNYKLLGRTAKEVVVSTDKKRLLMNITVDTNYRESDFRKISDGELNRLVTNLDNAKSYYQSIGFKKVALSVVPNAASVYDDQRMPYNHLLERVEKSNRFDVISIFNDFKTSNINLNYRSDAHWNPAGLDIWVTEAGKRFKKWQTN